MTVITILSFFSFQFISIYPKSSQFIPIYPRLSQFVRRKLWVAATTVGCLALSHTLYLCIWEIVFVYLRNFIYVFASLRVQNIIFDVFGPLAFQKYSIIRVYKVFWAWWQTTNKQQPGEPRASPLVEQWKELTFVIDRYNHQVVNWTLFPFFLKWNWKFFKNF